MKRLWGFLATVTAIATGAQAHAQTPISLKDAVTKALSNGCSGGLLSASEFNSTTTRSNVLTSSNFSLFGALPGPPATAPQLFKPDPNTPLDTPAKWISEDRYTITYSGGVIQGFTVTLPNTSSTDTQAPFEYLPQLNGNPVSNVVAHVTVTETSTVTSKKAPKSGLLGTQLAALCTTSGVQTSSVSASADFGFSFNDQGGGKDFKGASANLPTSGFTGNYSGGVQTSLGSGAARQHDVIEKQDDGWSEIVDRLEAKGQRKKEEQKKRAMLSMQEASNDPTFAPIPRDDGRVMFVFDATGGVINLDRAPSGLEGGFSSDSTVASVSGAAIIDTVFTESDHILFGFSAGYEDTDLTSAGSLPSNRSDAKTHMLSGAVFAGWTSPPIAWGASQPARVNATLLASYGDGRQSYNRAFQATYTDANAMTAMVTDALSAKVDQTYSSATMQVSASQAFGRFTVSPHVSYGYSSFKTGAYSENAGANGLGLRYAASTDHWNEGRVGAASALVVYDDSRLAVQLGAAADAVFIGDAATPEHVAYFVQDLRPTPTPIVYNVDSLDKQYYDLSASASARFSNGIEVYVSGFSRQGQKYINLNGVFAGVRLNF